MNTPLTVICATYNRAHTLARAIESVLNQSYPYWSLLIIDDGSTDHTSQVAQHYRSDDRIQYHQMTENKGVGFARNYALSKVKTSWCLLLDSDNALAAGALHAMAVAIHESGGMHLHKFCVRTFDDRVMCDVLDRKSSVSGCAYLKNRYKGEYHTLVPSELLRLYPFFEDVSGGEGILWNQIALKLGRVDYHSAFTLLYDVHGEDRLSVRSKNIDRLRRVFAKDIALLWRPYLSHCPGQLFVRLLKWMVYSILCCFKQKTAP